MVDHLRNSHSVGLEDLAILVLDEADRLLDALVFSSPAPCWREVMVAGRWALREPGQAERIAKHFEQAMAEIWSGT